ncbi:MAG: hypothetical protein RLY90_243 [Pseudomonadota bacterium]
MVHLIVWSMANSWQKHSTTWRLNKAAMLELEGTQNNNESVLELMGYAVLSPTYLAALSIQDK